MLFKKTPAEKTELEIAISDLFADMENADKASDEYAAMVSQMDTLYKLKEVDTKVKTKKFGGAEVWVPAVTSLLGILMIVDHERTNVLTSQALKLIPKFR